MDVTLPWKGFDKERVGRKRAHEDALWAVRKGLPRRRTKLSTSTSPHLEGSSAINGRVSLAWPEVEKSGKRRDGEGWQHQAVVQSFISSSVRGLWEITKLEK